MTCLDTAPSLSHSRTRPDVYEPCAATSCQLLTTVPYCTYPEGCTPLTSAVQSEKHENMAFNPTTTRGFLAAGAMPERNGFLDNSLDSTLVHPVCIKI